jgi:hypothetical protein
MKKLLVLVLFVVTSSYGQIKVSPDGHSLQYQNGRPFFWLGDTGWEMLNRLTEKEISMYLENRRQKGFNVIQTVILDDHATPDFYGNDPLIDKDPSKPNEAYFKRVDKTIQLALQKKMFIALLPTWGGNVNDQPLFNVKNAYSYGLFLGKRYSRFTNIIWITGGDRPALNDTMDWRPIWRSMIKGLRDGGTKALVTYHPAGESSSADFWKDSTLDFNMIQSGHRKHDLPTAQWIDRDYHLQPYKPVLDGEPNYEDHPVNWKAGNGYFEAYDVRKQLYRSVFSGACGVTYGHHAVWQFYSAHEKPISEPDRYWTAALDRPAAFQAGYLKQLVGHLERIPDATIAGGLPAFRDARNSYAMVYLSSGKRVTVHVSWMRGDMIRASWFNPRTGKKQQTGVFKKSTDLSFDPPTAEDWVLALDSFINK